VGWEQKIEYVEVEPSLPAPVRKQVWDVETKMFVPITLHRHMGLPDNEQIDWLQKTYGPGVCIKKVGTRILVELATT
jgi:hypothetical protein